jgi:outer membrane protein OmpA-like peptidoglycan-associated protein
MKGIVAGAGGNEWIGSTVLSVSLNHTFVIPDMRIVYLFLCFFFAAAILPAQELVPNDSFEEYKKCPGELGRMPEGWYAPTGGTPDYFNACAKGDAGVPKNMVGVQKAKSGKGYCGIAVHDIVTYVHEYIQAKLLQPLEKQEKYCVSFYVSLADFSNFESSGLGLILSKDSIHILKTSKDWWKRLPYAPDICDSLHYASSDTGWTLISGIYVAKGGEKFITIGNFFPDNKYVSKRPARKGLTVSGSYYYIDDVSVKAVKDEFECRPSTPLVLKNVFFKSGKSELLSTSFPELNKLVNALKSDPGVKAEISGHTDNTGDSAVNVKLSEARAKAVTDFLVSKGIKRERLSYKGYGDKYPIADNATAEGKQQNRRVSISFK